VRVAAGRERIPSSPHSPNPREATERRVASEMVVGVIDRERSVILRLAVGIRSTCIDLHF